MTVNAYLGDKTTLSALSSIAREQAKATAILKLKHNQLLNYLATYPDATVRFRASARLLNIHSDASHLSESQACSCLAGYFFLGDMPEDGKPMCEILQIVITSAAEAKLGTLFMNCKEGKLVILILEEMGHSQPPTPVHVNNSTAVGIVNDTVKKQRS